MRNLLRLILLLLFPAACWAQVPNQIVTLSADGKYLINSITSQPVFLTGDAPQLLFVQPSAADVDTYLADRQARGFNALWVYPVDAADQSNAPANFNGDVPFDGAAFTNFDPAYWAYVDSVMTKIQAKGMIAFVNVAYVSLDPSTGYENQILASSDATMTAYGTFLGNRYKNFNNIVWVLGGDADPSVSGLFKKLNDIGAGIAAADPNHLITLEACRICSPNNQSTINAYGGNPPSFIGLNWVYNMQTSVVAGCQAGFASAAAALPLMGEDWYELEHSMTGFQERQEGYWEVLSGCYLGRMFGNEAIYSFNSPVFITSPTWQSQLGSTGSVGQQYLGQLMRSREHWLMAPDTSHTVLTAGFGSGASLSVAARSSDGQTIIAYLSDGNATAKTVNMSKIVSSSSTAQAWWYNPRNSVATLIGTFPNSGSQSFTAPDGNDWVLVIDDASANLGAPGGGPANNPVPSISSLSPSTIAAGGPTFTLTVNGSGFISSSVVNFNGAAKTTTFVGASQITATILASDIVSSGNANVTVTNPAPGGGTTPNFAFVISTGSNPSPTLTSVSPASGTLGQGISLTLTGTNFISSSVVNFGSNADGGGVVSNGGNTLTIAIPSAQLSTAGPLNVTVTNPTPGGGTSSAQSFTVNNPAPALTSLSPSSVTQGGAGFTLTVNGSGFVSTSVVSFNGANKSTTFKSPTQLTASISASDILSAGSANVAVTNPAPGGGTSSISTFTINNPTVELTSLSPSNAVAGGTAFTLTVNGSGFVSGSVVNFGGAAKVTTFKTSSQLTAAISAADIASAGSVNVTVTNPPPGGSTSSAFVFSVNNPAPVLASLSPASAIAGGSAFTLTVNGSGFVSSSVVNFNGTVKTTTFKSATQLTAAIPASDILTVKTTNVTVTNPAPGGGTSGAQVFSINNPAPVLASLAPTSATEGGAAFTLTVNGTGFVAASVVSFKGAAKATTFKSATQLTAAIAAADIATAGTANVAVTNPTPGGGTSASLQFTINNPIVGITSIAPTSAISGGASFTLTVNGSGFVSGSVVNFNGSAKTTTFKSASQLTASIAAGDIAAGGIKNVTVTNPAPGGGTSSAASFTVNNAPPTVTSLSPASATAGTAAFTLTINGTGFLNGATVQFHGANRTTSFVNSSRVTASILASDIAAAGTPSVTVTNPAPTTGPSAPPQIFTVNSSSTPAPTITTLGTTHAAGGAPFTLTVNGTNFVAKSVVNFNGKAEATTFVSATKISAAIPAADVASAGNVDVTVTTPAPGGGTSAASTFTVDGYTVSGPGTASLAPGQPAVVQLTVAPSANGFANPILFTVSGQPAGNTASFKPTSVTPNGKSAVTVLTISGVGFVNVRPSPDVHLPASPQVPPSLGLSIAALLGCLFAGTWIRRVPQLKRYEAVVFLALILVAGTVLTSCGDTSGTGSPGATTSHLTVTAKSGTMTQTMGITLTVSQ